MAPRFVGEFQKGIDYIGDLAEFEKQFAVHCAIARARGGYKISIHSGSDKFSVYPAIGRHTGMRLHLKTAGTSWLQAVRVIARTNPPLFRRMLARAIAWFPRRGEALPRRRGSRGHPAGRRGAGRRAGEVPGPAGFPAAPAHHLRRCCWTTPGSARSFSHALEKNEEAHYAAVQEHMERHIRLLGVPRKGVPQKS